MWERRVKTSRGASGGWFGSEKRARRPYTGGVSSEERAGWIPVRIQACSIVQFCKVPKLKKRGKERVPIMECQVRHASKDKGGRYTYPNSKVLVSSSSSEESIRPSNLSRIDAHTRIPILVVTNACLSEWGEHVFRAKFHRKRMWIAARTLVLCCRGRNS